MGASFKLDKKNFSKEIEEYRLNKIRKGIECTYMDAILALCQEKGIDESSLEKSKLSKSILEKLKYEGQKLHLLPKTNELNLDQ